jgi:hypothetical protein
MTLVDQTMDEIRQEDLTARVYDGQLVSLERDGVEFMHGADKPEEAKIDSDRNPAAWSHSELVMFPVVGPTADSGYKVKTPAGEASLDQHGISRLSRFANGVNDGKNICVTQDFHSNTVLKNPRFEPDKGNPAELTWPYDATLSKKVGFDGDLIRVDFTLENQSKQGMPYTLGWHPAFRTQGVPYDKIRFHPSKQESFTLDDVLNAPGHVKRVSNNGLIFVEYGKTNVCLGVVSLEGFKHFVVWTPKPDAGMFCVEPVTHQPVRGPEQKYFNGANEVLPCGASKLYSVAFKLEI